ncbi:hypothetical protein NDU88_005739 [Pleurodeles waltl]|uniref:Uncharacterized protein n=1 Tax=Pleurodeles waltl TaxID=8319 RepID=A0AAV7PGK0_PLEWA|nr:hypothetical protein NDU88_005739 [Pleurodeles waltl]
MCEAVERPSPLRGDPERLQHMEECSCRVEEDHKEETAAVLGWVTTEETSSGMHKLVNSGERRNSPDASLAATLAEHSQRFNDIKDTLEPKIEALCIDMGHLREDHKKLKD